MRGHAARRRVVVIATAAWLAIGTASARADAVSGPSLGDVIDSLRAWVMGLLAALATLFLTIGGVRYIAAGGDPGQVERAKQALRSAAIGYALAALAPLLVQVLRSVVHA